MYKKCSYAWVCLAYNYLVMYCYDTVSKRPSTRATWCEIEPLWGLSPFSALCICWGKTGSKQTVKLDRIKQKEVLDLKRKKNRKRLG